MEHYFLTAFRSTILQGAICSKKMHMDLKQGARVGS